MSQPLNPNCTDFQALQFFKDCKNEIRRIAQESKLQKTISRTMAKVEELRSDKTENLDKMLLYNIVVDFLRSSNLNYSYPVFLRECNVIPEEVVSKSKLAALIGVSHELNNDERFNVSLIELMVKKIQNHAQKSKDLVQCGLQVEIIKKSGSQDNVLLMEIRAKEIRDQVQQRERKHYQKQLQNMRLKEIMELRRDIVKQVQQKYNKEKIKLNQKFQELIGKAKSNQNPSKLKQENEKLLELNFQLSQQVPKLKKQLEIIKQQNLRHECTKNPEHIKLIQTMKKERKQVEEKKKELDYALRNLNTKVEDLVMQKRKIQGQKKTDAFNQQIKVNRQNKDHMIEIISAEMKQMCNRANTLGEENMRLRQNVKELAQKLKEKDLECKKVREQVELLEIGQGRPSNPAHQPRTQVDGKQDHLRTIKQNGDSYPYGIRDKKIEKVSICIGVKEEDIIEEYREPEQVNVVSESESDGDQFEDKQLEHNKRLAEIRANMNIIKKKVLLLVNDDI